MGFDVKSMKSIDVSGRVIDLSARFPFLKESGIAAEFFPDFRNGERILHSHNYMEILFIVSGSGIYLVCNKEYPLKKGTLAIIHWWQTHVIITDKMSIFNIYLKPEWMPRPSLPPNLILLFDKYFSLYTGLNHEPNNVYHFDFPEDKSPEDLLVGMKRETDLPHPLRIMVLRQLYL